MAVNDPTQVQTQTTVSTTTAVGGIVGEAEQALATQPIALLKGVAGALAYCGALFALTLVCALAGNKTAQGYVAAIFGAGAIWAIVGIVLLGAAYVAPSPLKK